MGDNILSDNLHKLMSNARLTASELGRILNLPAATIKKLRTGENKNPTISTLKPIAKYFKITISQLIGETQLNNNSIVSYSDNLFDKKSLTNLAPVISLNEAKNWHNNNYQPNSNPNNQIMVEQYISNRAYALVLGANYSLFKKGGVIIVEPVDVAQNHAQLINNQRETYALIQKHGQEIPTLKQILTEDGNIYMQSLIPEINITQLLTEEYKILGIVVGYKHWFTETLHQ